ncbi:MAG: hypothetical protein M0Z53_00950 [Thermaerobacter sp.]|nr:hypothetical protein [Thermaerobacter sp.]
MQFVLRGEAFELTPEAIAQQVDGVQPQPFARYAVKIGSVWYPPKQVLAQVTGLPVAAFTTQDAYRIMHRLGFPVVLAATLTKSPAPPKPD